MIRITIVDPDVVMGAPIGQVLGPESGALKVCLTVDGTANSSTLMFLKCIKFFSEAISVN